jgi:hypothetical protein
MLQKLSTTLLGFVLLAMLRVLVLVVLPGSLLLLVVALVLPLTAFEVADLGRASAAVHPPAFEDAE